MSHTIFEGTSEIQQLVVSRAIPGLLIEWSSGDCSRVGVFCHMASVRFRVWGRVESAGRETWR